MRCSSKLFEMWLRPTEVNHSATFSTGHFSTELPPVCIESAVGAHGNTSDCGAPAGAPAMGPSNAGAGDAGGAVGGSAAAGDSQWVSGLGRLSSWLLKGGLPGGGGGQGTSSPGGLDTY